MAGVKSDGAESGGTRVRQRQRTRQAIVSAASDLLAEGAQPSVGDVANAASVSRRTVYMYFPTLEHLLADAALEAARGMVEPEFALTQDAGERVEAMVRAVQRSSLATEAIGRTIIRHTIEPRPEPAEQTEPRRGYRRVEWIEMALEPVRERLAPADFERLVSGLSLLVCWEALLVLRDLRGLTPAEAEDVSAWAAGALLAAALAPGD